METSRKLLRVFLENLVVPVAVGVDDLSVVVDYIKRGAVRYVRRRFGNDLELSANLLQKSTRWIYRILEQDKGGVTGGLWEEDAEERAQTAHMLKRSAVQFFQSRYPQSLPAAECTRALRKEGYRVNARQLEPLLDAYCTMGHLIETVTREGDRRVVSYRAAQPFDTEQSPDELSSRLAVVAVRSRAIFPIALGYVGGQPGVYFAGMGGEVLEDEYLRLGGEIGEAVERLISEAVQRTQQRWDPNQPGRLVRFKGLYMLGHGTWTEFEFFKESVVDNGGNTEKSTSEEEE